MDMKELRKYVVAKDGMEYDGLKGTDIVCLNVVHSNLKQIWPDIRLSLYMKIITVKEKLYKHGGTSPVHQKLLLIPKGKNIIAGSSSAGASMANSIPLDDDEKMLGYYGAQSGMDIYIMDTDPFSLSKNGGLEDTSLVKKYVMSDEDYEKREDSARNFKKKMQQTDPNWTFLPKSVNKPSSSSSCCNGSHSHDHASSHCDKDAINQENKSTENVSDAAKDGNQATIKVGDRCELVVGGSRGKVMYVGDGEGFLKILPSSLQWIGVCLDEPLGTCDGSEKGKKLFSCPKNHGLFVSSDKVRVGDYPEHDPFKDEEDDEI